MSDETDYPRLERHSVEDLRLDASNYRLAAEVAEGDPSQDELVRHIEEYFDLEELAVSFIGDGYRREEPLVGVTENGQLVIVEGNRRLTTLKLLHSDQARQTLPTRMRERWTQLGREASEADHELSAVPVVVYEDRTDVEASLGFRHVSGIAQWSAESKARYIRDLVNGGHTFAQVAGMIGSRRDFVRRQYYAREALGQAAASGLDDSRALRKFGVFYRALSSPHTRAYIGLDWDASEDVTSPRTHDVIDQSRLQEFSNFLSFVFGSSEHPPVIRDSRQLTDLGRILDNDEATAVLIDERDFALALDVVGTDGQRVVSQLRGALTRLRAVNGVAFEFQGDRSVLDLAQRCEATINQVLQTLTEGTGTGAEGENSPDQESARA